VSGEPLILVVDDERPIRRALEVTLTKAGYRVATAAGAAEALTAAALTPPDLVILDLMLPDGDGAEVCAQLRDWLSAPILLISAVQDEPDKIRALDAGADDYLTKPFGVGELLARVRAAQRRRVLAGSTGKPSVRFGDVEVDLVARTVRKHAEAVHLTPIEYRLLALLIASAGKVLTHRQICRDVWGPAHEQSAHYARIYMGHLRQKLEDDPAQPKYILTETGVGYRLSI
jgi:two-component system KDP operon response regulator KdpE